MYKYTVHVHVYIMYITNVYTYMYHCTCTYVLYTNPLIHPTHHLPVASLTTPMSVGDPSPDLNNT